MATATATTNGKRGAGRVNMIGNFIVDKVDLSVMKAYAEENDIKLEVSDDADAEQYAVALTQHFRNTVGHDELAKCDTCGGEGPESDAVCAFCGVEVEEEEDDPGVEGEDEEDENEIEDDEEEAPSPKVAAKPAKKDEVKMSDAMTETTKPQKRSAANGKATNGKAKTTTAMVKATTGGVQTATQLDRAIEEIQLLKINAAKNYRALGLKLAELHDSNLWKLREEGGKVRYASFDAFVKAEIGFMPANASDMMKVAKNYTEAQIEAVGRRKLSYVVKAPPEDRAKILEAAKNPKVTSRQIADEVKKAKKKRGYKGETELSRKRSEAGLKGAAKKHAATPKDKITVASIEGTKNVKLYAKPATMKNLDLSTLKMAKTLGDVPFGRLELVNDVVMYFSVVKNEKTGGLVLKVTTLREHPIED